jgi:hypothetical protein
MICLLFKSLSKNCGNLYYIFHFKYYSANQNKKNEMGWSCGMYGEVRRYIPEGEILQVYTTGRHRNIWENNIKKEF